MVMSRVVKSTHLFLLINCYPISHYSIHPFFLPCLLNTMRIRREGGVTEKVGFSGNRSYRLIMNFLSISSGW